MQVRLRQRPVGQDADQRAGGQFPGGNEVGQHRDPAARDEVDGASHDGLDDEAFVEAVGDVLWAVVDRARRLGIDPEDALRATTVARLADLRARERPAVGGRVERQL